MTEEAAAPKKRPGRPRTKPAIVESPKKAATKFKMKAKPNWDDIEDVAFEDNPDRLKIDRDMIPEGMDLLWVANTVFGQPQPQRRADFEKRGWTPVHQEDFDGQFNGMWMAKDAPGEITHEGVVLMARPLELSIRARRQEARKATEQVQIKEAALRGGDIPGVTLDSQHPNAVKVNRINKSFERIEVPED